MTCLTMKGNGVPYGSRTRVVAVKEKRHGNLMKVRGMDCTFTALKRLTGTLIGRLMDARANSSREKSRWAQAIGKPFKFEENFN